MSRHVWLVLRFLDETDDDNHNLVLGVFAHKRDASRCFEENRAKLDDTDQGPVLMLRSKVQ